MSEEDVVVVATVDNEGNSQRDISEAARKGESEATYGFAISCADCGTFIAPSNGGRFKCTFDASCEHRKFCLGCVCKGEHALIRIFDENTMLNVGMGQTKTQYKSLKNVVFDPRDLWLRISNPCDPPPIRENDEEETQRFSILSELLYGYAADVWKLRGCPEKPQEKMTHVQSELDKQMRYEAMDARFEYYLQQRPECDRLKRKLDRINSSFDRRTSLMHDDENPLYWVYPDGSVREVELAEARRLIESIFSREDQWRESEETKNAMNILSSFVKNPSDTNEFTDSCRFDTVEELIDALHDIKERAFRTFKIFEILDHLCKLIDRIEAMAGEYESTQSAVYFEETEQIEEPSTPLEGSLSDYITETINKKALIIRTSVQSKWDMKHRSDALKKCAEVSTWAAARKIQGEMWDLHAASVYGKEKEMVDLEIKEKIKEEQALIQKIFEEEEGKRIMAEEGEEGQASVADAVREESSHERIESFHVEFFLEELRERRKFSDEDILNALKESRRKREVGGVGKVGGVEDKTTLEFYVDSFETHLEKQIVDAKSLLHKSMVIRESWPMPSVQAHQRKRDDAVFDLIQKRMKQMDEEKEKKEGGEEEKKGEEKLVENGTVNVEENSGCSLM
ncbi:hypothetical protein PFISCL1PPCAC_9223 [Pristionchus fissidentatus]|uniref:Uncharacterized protein n=1 Tax=Pristionchus fissidentatus TaxID=1538716 RepID=A0AAV5VE13_9BILA|nr:hypothetical protein PFISCL1PPCAC_9223 [Pristionchus fissidentatus]